MTEYNSPDIYLHLTLTLHAPKSTLCSRQKGSILFGVLHTIPGFHHCAITTAIATILFRCLSSHAPPGLSLSHQSAILTGEKKYRVRKRVCANAKRPFLLISRTKSHVQAALRLLNSPSYHQIEPNALLVNHHIVITQPTLATKAVQNGQESKKQQQYNRQPSTSPCAMATVSITSDLEPYLASLRSYLEDQQHHHHHQQTTLSKNENPTRCSKRENAAEERSRLKEVDGVRTRPPVTKSLALRPRV